MLPPAPTAAEMRHREREFSHRHGTGQYLADVILGANDGLVTTFAVVAGASGARLPAFVVVVLGLANLLADGLSMGLGNYLGQKSERDYQRRQRQREEAEVIQFPDIERREVAEVFTAWGFGGPLLEQATDTIAAVPKRWVDFMMREELNIIEDQPASPARRGLATFVAFIIAGLVPLIPYVLRLSGATAVQVSIGMTAAAMVLVGASRSIITVQKWYWGGLQMLVVGGAAAGVAYLVGFMVARWIG